MPNKRPIKKFIEIHCVACGRKFVRYLRAHQKGYMRRNIRPGNVVTCSQKCARTYRNINVLGNKIYE